MILFVDPASVCNFKCIFCPTGDLELIRQTGRWQGVMNFELYKNIIDDLKEFDQPLKVLRLYKDGEPFLNKDFAQMVKYAKDSGRVDYIDTTTNGSLLDLDRVKPAIEAGLDRINISVDGLSDEQFFRFTRTKVNFAEFVEKIQNLYEHKQQCEIFVKIVGDEFTEEERTFFFDTFGDFADGIFIENYAPCWPQFDVETRMGVEITRGIYQQPIGETNVCPYIFYQMAVNSDGTVSSCFLDWSRRLIMGDVRKESLKEIWDGEALFQLRRNHLLGKRKENPVCAVCGQLSHCLPDNIDLYAGQLLEKLMTTCQ